jgi:trans-AT polyketide synthase/acyltransferase/oxidoreductase domain-containing protein
MFPGQGSQQLGMGESLFSKYRSEIEIANKILGYSIEELCLSDPDSLLGETQYTQPALFTVNALYYFDAIKSENKPRYYIGHSLGEYNALHAAGVLDFDTGIKLTKLRGMLMSKARKGSMAAVIGIEGSQVQEVITNSNLKNVYVANFNSNRQTVISGLDCELDKALNLLEDEVGVVSRRLPVSGAFHSPLMKQAREEYKAYLSSVKFCKTVSSKVISNVTAKPYSDCKIEENLLMQITSPVLWHDSIIYLKKMGENNFNEIGPGSVLRRLVSYIE